MPIRSDFPAEGSVYLGGTSDGLVYRTVFAGATLAQTYEMIRCFLAEEGYGDVPLPQNVEELKKFKTPPAHRQMSLFDTQGYAHNPVKILFPVHSRQKKALVLEIYNENAPDHLLRFHGRL